jgi:Na+/H+-dicarboxylate symporter
VPGAALDAVVLNQPAVGQIFLRLLFMLVIPLVFAGLALGVSASATSGASGASA